jgi:hypothetical protein
MSATVSTPSIKGKLSTSVHPAKLVVGFFKAKKSGLLTFRDGITEITLYLKNGCIVFDREAVHQLDDFGQYLVTKGVVTLKEYMQYRNTARDQNMAVRDVILFEKMIDTKLLESYAAQYYWETIPTVFSWRHGNWIFFEMESEIPAESVSRPKMIDFILKSIRDQYQPNIIHERLQKRFDTPTKVVENGAVEPSELDRLPEAASILRHARQGKTLHEMLDAADSKRFEILSLAYGLLTLEVLKFAMSAEKKVEITTVKRLKKAATPLDRAFLDALKSVDRIRQKVTDEPGEVEIPITVERPASLGNVPESDDEVEEELQKRIQKLIDIKRKKRAMVEERIKAEPSGKKPAETAPGAPLDEEALLKTMMGEIRRETEETSATAGSKSAADVAENTAEEGTPEGVPFNERDFDLDLFDESISAKPPEESGSGDPDFYHEIEPATSEGQGLNDLGIPEDGKIRFGPEESVENIIKALRDFCEDGRWEEAEAAFNELVFREYETPDSLALGGWTRYHLPGPDPFAAGASLIQKAIEKNPGQELPYLMMGKIYMEENDRNMAELYLVRAIEVNRDCFEAKELIKKLYLAR